MSLRPVPSPDGRHGIVLFHGLSSSPLELQFVARGLQRAGYTVKLPRVPGYTFDPSGVRTLSTVRQWIAHGLHEVEAMALRCPRVSIGGLCLGSVLALNVAARMPMPPASLLCLSTALHYDGWGNPWYSPLLPLARWVPPARQWRVAEREPFGLKDPRMREWVATQMRERGRSAAGAATLRVNDLLKARELTALARRALPSIDAPILLIHAKEDECATPRSSFEVAQRVRSTRTRVVLLSDSYHMISIDREKDRVLAEMLAFLSHEQRARVEATTEAANAPTMPTLQGDTLR